MCAPPPPPRPSITALYPSPAPKTLWTSLLCALPSTLIVFVKVFTTPLLGA
jgi:hypothetical protein